MASAVLRRAVGLTAVLGLAAYVTVYTLGYAREPIRSDGIAYYSYLPAAFIYGDLTFEELCADRYNGAAPASALRRWPSTGRWLNATPIGVAVLSTPFFLVGHFLTWWSNLPPDGFSLFYQHAAGLAGLAYLIAGVALMRRLLLGRFADGVVLATLVCVTFGTNAFHYATYDSTFSHSFSFGLICGWMLLVDRWWTAAAPSARFAVVLGAVAGLIVVTRAMNVVFLVLLPLYGVTRVTHLKDRLLALWRRRGLVLVAASVGSICLIPQLVLYKWSTGRWLVNSYALMDERFDFHSHNYLAVLFSTQKGLFFWSPVLLLAVAGAIVATEWAASFLAAVVVVFVYQTYLVANWGDWQFGASYGHRAFTDGLGLTAPLIASLFARVADRPYLRTVTAAFATAAVGLSVIQMVQYWQGIVPLCCTTWAQYQGLFLHFR